jgi:phosphatidate phosphatase APP1
MIKRPKLVHLTAIDSGDAIHIRASLSLSSQAKFDFMADELSDFSPSKPLKSLGLLRSRTFKLTILGLGIGGDLLTTREIETDDFGNVSYRIMHPTSHHIERIQIYETKTFEGIDALIGTYIPVKLPKIKKIIISDFDKTLVDTRYSSPRELFLSLRNPISYFPKVEPSVEIMKNYMDQGHIPFILSASPHFYLNAIRDWLYQNQIFTNDIFLKDYRNIFSFFSGDLTTKDLKSQGFYKLQQLVNVLLMTGVPDELVLMGDGFESDTLIYLCLVAILQKKIDPRELWVLIKAEESFQLKKNQNSILLNHLYQLRNLVNTKTKIKVYIRCTKKNHQSWLDKRMHPELLNQLKHHVHFYVG